MIDVLLPCVVGILVSAAGYVLGYHHGRTQARRALRCDRLALAHDRQTTLRTLHAIITYNTPIRTAAGLLETWPTMSGPVASSPSTPAETSDATTPTDHDPRR